MSYFNDQFSKEPDLSNIDLWSDDQVENYAANLLSDDGDPKEISFDNQ